MRFHCNACNRDFTTLAERDKAKKFNFSHLVLDKMFCPYCGARNHAQILKPLKVTRNRYQPKRRSTDTDDFTPPNIVVFSECQKRMIGTLYSPEGLSVMCEGCRFAFGCLTGNVDDGILETDDPDYIVRQKEKQVIEANKIIAKKKRDDEVTYLLQLRNQLGKVKFGYGFRKSMWYCKFGGTIWKLSSDDIEAIQNNNWDTAKTSVIKRSLEKREIKLALAKLLLGCELLIQRRQEGLTSVLA